jgi:hypothetical protein
LPSPFIAVCPEQYRVRVCPETSSPWLNPLSSEPDADGRLRLEVTFQDARHAEWALWQLGTEL